MVITKDLGAVSAYAYAVEQGYQGTEEQFAELMARQATVAEEAAASADAAAESEQNAAASEQNAVTSATAASGSAATASTKATEAESYASGAASSAATASTKATETESSATAAAQSASSASTAAQNAASSAQSAESSATDAEQAKTDAQDAQTAAEAAAQSVSESAAQIAKNTADIADLENAVYSGSITNIILPSNFRSSTSSGDNYVEVDKPNLSFTYRWSHSNNSDTCPITDRTNPFTFDTTKEYVVYVRVQSLEGNYFTQGWLGLQTEVDGQIPEDIIVYGLALAPTMNGVIATTFTPTKSRGYLRFAFNGLGTASHLVNLHFDKFVLCEKPSGATDDEIFTAIGNASNPISELKIAKSQELYKREILFWGDSLTAGAGGNGTTFPMVCANELDKTYLNCGVGGESANTVSARQGGNNIVIPAGAINGTYTSFTDLFGGTVSPLLQGNGSNSGNSLVINGETCSLAYASGTGYMISGYTGDATSVPVLAKFGGSDFTGKTVVIFVGQNGATVTGLEYTNALITIIDSMIAHIGHTRYVIMGRSSGTDALRATEDSVLLTKYGNRFFPTRKMLVNYGLTINGLTPTEQDTTDISNGTVPSSLRSDSVHMNAYGYTAIGKMLADKIRSLGYV